MKECKSKKKRKVLGENERVKKKRENKRTKLKKSFQKSLPTFLYGKAI